VRINVGPSLPLSSTAWRQPLPTVKRCLTVLLGNVEAESVLHGVMHAWSVTVRLLNVGVNSWCELYKEILLNVAVRVMLG
jgi:hypothetical protein